MSNVMKNSFPETTFEPIVRKAHGNKQDLNFGKTKTSKRQQIRNKRKQKAALRGE
jgi:hypothetical protein